MQRRKLQNAIALYLDIENWYETFLKTDKETEYINTFDRTLPDYGGYPISKNRLHSLEHKIGWCNMIKKLLYDFIGMVEEDQVQIYNEFSLQHELGIFLREQLPDYKVQFERNTKFFEITGTIKHEIDIVVYNDTEKYAVELKYPLNGQYPEQMYSFIKDIIFMEQLSDNGFDATYSLTMVNDKNFYSGKKVDDIYSYFRGEDVLQGTIKKPTGKKEESITLSKKYSIKWEGKTDRLKYYIVDVNEGK